MRNLSYLLYVLLMFLVVSCGNQTNKTPEGETDSQRTLSLLFVGDMMQHQLQINKAADGNGGYDYSDYFTSVKDEIEAADVAVANFEVTLGGAPYKGHPQFSAPDEYAKAIKEAGFDVLLTSNNHSCDTRAKGLERTIKVLDSLKIPHLGTYRNAAERSKQYPFLLEKNGFRIALLVYTYGTNGIKVPEPCVVNLIDTVQMAKDINAAKALNPDAIIACMHWGVEYKLQPNSEQKQLADWLLNHGVAHVIGGHPHVVEPVEMRQDAAGQKHLVVWSLGNYISNMTTPTTAGGLMVRLDLEKDSVVRVSDASYSLVFVSRPVFSGRKNFCLFPVDKADALMNSAEKSHCNSFMNSISSVFTSPRGKITVNK